MTVNNETHVIYLRHGKHTKDKETVLVRMPDGRELEYAVPVVKSQKYEKEEIFKKKLYVLLPYYILRYEKQLVLIEKEEDRRQRFLVEYENICDRLIETLGKENPLAYSELHKLMKRIQEYVLKKKAETRKGVQQVMGGHVLESWKEEMIRIGRTEGLAQGHAEALEQGLSALVNSLKEYIADEEDLYQAVVKNEAYKNTLREEVLKYLK